MRAVDVVELVPGVFNKCDGYVAGVGVVASWEKQVSRVSGPKGTTIVMSVTWRVGWASSAVAADVRMLERVVWTG